MSDSGENTLETELESLEAIYINELTYSRNQDGTINQIELLLHPSTGHDLTKQYVCMTLVFTLNSAYPSDPPEIEIRNPRGLGEEEISSLVEDMILKAESMRDDAMLYTLIEMAKDSLTEGNVPHCPCVVCLEHFDNPDSFHRTACYHYFHTHCLLKYLLHTRVQMEEDGRDTSERRHLDVSSGDKNNPKKIMCPVCRSLLDEKSLAITCSPELLADDDKTEVFVIPAALREQQLKMSQLYECQKAKGGIIDLELEKNKYLVNPEDRWPIRSATTTPPVTSPETSSNLSGKNDLGSRREDRPKQGRGRGNFHHGRYGQDWYGPSKGKPAPRTRTANRHENTNRYSSGGTNRGVKDRTENSVTKDEKVSGEKEAAAENVRRQESTESGKRDHDKCGNDRIDREDREYKVRGKGGSSERSKQEEDSVAKDSSWDNVERGSKEHQEVKDVSDRATDGYKHSHKGPSVRAYDSGRGRGRFESRRKYESRPDHRYGEEHNGHYYHGDRQLESGTRRIVEPNGGSRESNPSTVGFGSNGDRKRIDRVGGEFVDNKEGTENVAQSVSCFTASVQNEELRGASGSHQTSAREMNSRLGGYDDEYRRGDMGAQPRGARHYGRKESGEYKRGGGQRGRGFDSGHKGSKFNDRRGENHTEQSRQPHVRNNRPYQQHSNQQRQQHHYHHSRQEEARERVNRPKTDDRVENNSDTRADVSEVYGTGASSETVAQDEEEEEADFWQHSATSPWQSSTIEHFRRGTGGNELTHKDAVCLRRLHFNGKNDIFNMRTNPCNPHNSKNTGKPECGLQRDASYKLDKECKNTPCPTTNRMSKQTHKYVDHDDNGNRSRDGEHHLEGTARCKSEIELNQEILKKSQSNTQTNVSHSMNIERFPSYRTNSHNSDYIVDDSNNFDDQYNLEINYDLTSNVDQDKPSCLAHITDVNYDDNDNETWDDEVNIYDFERYKIRPEHREDYYKQVAPRDKHFENRLKERVVMEDEFRRIRNEQLKRGDGQEFECRAEGKSEDSFKGKSVLEVFKESQAKQREDSNRMKGNGCGRLSVPGKPLAKCDDQMKNLGQNIIIHDSAINSHQGPRTNVSGQGQLRKGSGLGQHARDAGQGQHMKDSGHGQLKKCSIGFTKDARRNTFLHPTSSSNNLSTTDEYLSLKSQHLEGSSLPSCTVVTAPSYSEGFVSADMATDTGSVPKVEGVVPKGESSVHTAEFSAIPQSFNANLKKAPPLDFSKRTSKIVSNNLSVCSALKTSAGNEKIPTGEASFHSSSIQDLEQVVGAKWALEMNELCNLYSLPLDTTMSKPDTQPAASVSDLSAALLNSYRMSCSVGGSLPGNCQSSSGADPTLFSRNGALLGNTGMCLGSLYASNHQEAYLNVFCNNSRDETANAEAYINAVSNTCSISNATANANTQAYINAVCNTCSSSDVTDS